jgi:peptide/nickel transport system substrate-binding protein
MNFKSIGRRRSYLAACAVVVTTLMVAACGSTPSSNASKTTNSSSTTTNATLTVGVPTFGSNTSIPWIGGNTGDTELWAEVYDTLVTFCQTCKQTALVPDLATSWLPSDNDTVWTLHLRHGVDFQKGYGEFTSADAQFTLENMAQPGATGQQSGYFQANLASVTTDGPFTVVLHMKSPNWTLPYYLAQDDVWMLSKKYITKVGTTAAAENPVGTGPYEFVGGTPGVEFTFKANPKYFLHKASYQNLTIKRIPDTNTLLSALESGQVNVAALSGDYIPEAKSAGLKVFGEDDAVAATILLPDLDYLEKDYDPSLPWVGNLADPNSASYKKAALVREALGYAIDMKAIVKDIYAGYGSTDPIGFDWGPGMPGFSNSWNVLPYDPTKAKALLAEAGYPHGFSITIDDVPVSIYSAAMSQAIQEYWAAIGLNATVQNMEETTFFSDEVAGTFPGAFYSPGVEPPLEYSITTENSTSATKFNPVTPQINALSLDASKTIPVTARTALEMKFQDTVIKDNLVIRLGWQGVTYVTTKSVGSITLKPGNSILCQYEWIAPTK